MNPKITVSYCDGCHIEIICPNYRNYNIVITDGQNEKTGNVLQKSLQIWLLKR